MDLANDLNDNPYFLINKTLDPDARKVVCKKKRPD